MSNAKFNIPLPPNEPVKGYLPGSPERIALKAKLEEMQNQQIDIPIIIGGKEIRTGETENCILPHDHKTVIGKYHKSGVKEIKDAIESALEAHKFWSRMNWYDRASVFLKAADMLAFTEWRYII